MSDARGETSSTNQGYRLASLISLIVAPVLVIVGAVLFFMTLHSVEASRGEVEASYRARLQIQRVFSLLQDAETGSRGFQVTGHDNYLEPYRTAEEALPAQMAALEQLFASDPAQMARLRILRAQEAEKMRIIAEGVRIRRTQGVEAGRAYVATERGKRIMDAIRRTVNDMVQAESRSLDARVAVAKNAARQVEIVGGLLIALLIGVIVYAAFLVRRYDGSRQTLIDRIQQQSERQTAIFEGTMDAIITLNPSGSIESVNRAAEEMFGWSRDELTRRDISLLVDLAPGEGVFLQRLASQTGLGAAREMAVRRKDGSTFEAEVALGAMRQQDGIHVVAAIRDISDRRAAERLKEEFVSTVSHELRTPLTSIAGSLGLLEAGLVGELPEKAARLVYIAKASSERLVRLINDLLDVEKIASGHVRFEMQPVELSAAARRAVEGVSAVAAERRVTIHLDAPGEPPQVYGDPDRLIQVFTNLLSNAVKFSPEGETVDFTLASDGRSVRAVVRDRGPGVPESFRADIFHKFAQADSSSARGKSGTGLGLAISKEIVERHHGRIRLASPPGEGAVFEVELPLLSEAGVTDEQRAHVLVCEDDQHAAEVLSECLKRDGFLTERVGSIAEAEAALARRRFAALVLDLNLPDGNGLSLIQRLRAGKRFSELPIVVVTGEADDQQALGGVLAIADWIQKPVDPRRLSQSIRAALPGRSDLCILHVDDDLDLIEVVRAALAGAGDIKAAASLSEARRLFRVRSYDLVVLDVGLPDGSGLDLLADIAAADPRPPVVVYSGQEIDPALLGQVDAVLTKSRTSFEALAETVRKLTNRQTE